MGEFVGKRIVPRHEGEWDNTRTYEPLMIVLDPESGDGYISRYDVPAGTALTNTHYWALCSHFNAQMNRLETDLDTDVTAMQRDVANAKQSMSTQVSDALSTMTQNLNQTKQSMSQELAVTHDEMRAELDTAKSVLSEKADDATAATNDARAEISKAVEQLTKRLDANVIAHTTANGDYAAEVVDARVDTHGEAHDNLGAYLRLMETAVCTTRIEGLFINPTGGVTKTHSSYSGHCTEKIVYDASLGGIAVEANKLVLGNQYVSGMAFYDKNGKFLKALSNRSDFLIEENMAIAVASIIPEETAYFAMSLIKSAPYIWYRFTEGSKNDYNQETTKRLIEAVRDEFDEQHIREANISNEPSCSANLINLEDEHNLYGHYLFNNGLIGDNESYLITGYIPVVPGRSYTMNAFIGGGYSCVYDVKFNFICSFQGEMTIPENGRYVRLSVAFNKGTPMFYPTNQPPNGFEKYVPVGQAYQHIAEIREELKRKLEGTQGKNLFNKDSEENIFGQYLAKNGVSSTHTDYFITHYIPVEAGKIYSLTNFHVGGAFHCVYAADRITCVLGFQESVVEIPSDGAFLRLSGRMKLIESEQVEEGETKTEYEPYTLFGFLNPIRQSVQELAERQDAVEGQKESLDNALEEIKQTSGAALRELEQATQDITSYVQDIQESAGTIEGKLDKVIGKNLLNTAPYAITEGKYVMANGVLGVNASYYASSFIPVEAGMSYVLQGFGSGGAYHCVYAEDMREVLLSFQNNSVTIPDGGKYIRLSGRVADKGKQQIEKGTVATEYQPYTEYAPAQENSIRIAKLESGMADAIATDLRIVLPDTLFLCKDIPLSFYYENILYKSLSDAADIYCSQGKPYKRLLNLEQQEEGETTAQFTIMRALKRLKAQEHQVITTDPAKNSGKLYNMLFIGDSYTDGGVYIKETVRLLKEDGAEVNLLGTCGNSTFRAEGLSGGTLSNTFLEMHAGVARVLHVSGVKVPPNTGYPGRMYRDDNGNDWITRGWSLDENGDGRLVVTKYQAKDTDFENFPASGTLTKVSSGGEGDEIIHYAGIENAYYNPFINPETGVLDIQHYLEYWEYPNPDVVVFQFTWNDAGPWLADDSRLVDNFVRAVNHVHENLPETHIIISIEPFGSIYSGKDWNGKKYTVLNLVEHLCEVFERDEYRGFCRIAPSYACVDLIYGYSDATVVPNKRYPSLIEQNAGDGIHPRPGMVQIADCLYPIVTYMMKDKAAEGFTEVQT